MQAYGSPKAVNRALARAEAKREDYLPHNNGPSGEPDASSRDSQCKDPVQDTEGDNVVISAPVIPNPMNVANRNLMERRLASSGARIYTNAHVSGHAGREDHRDFIRMLNPMHIIPAHGDLNMLCLYRGG